MSVSGPEVVLVTGAPGLQARMLVSEILRSEPETRVRIVARASDSSDVGAMLAALGRDAESRVEVTEGDPCAIDLGLAAHELRAFTAEITRIHHVAHVTRLGADGATCERENVGGTREILEVGSLSRRLRCLVLHSTVHVSGRRQGLVLEDELARGQRFHNAVEETAARAEKMARAAMPRVPVAVVRPAILTGDSTTGELDVADGIYLLVLLILTSPPDLPLPLVGKADHALQIVPVDFVARVSRMVGLDEKSPGRTFHLVDPAPPTLRRVFELVARAGGRGAPRSFVPANVTEALLRAPGIDRFAKSPRAFLETLATPVSYSQANTRELLASADVRCPPFESYVDHLVAFVKARMLDRRARRERAADRAEDPLV